MRIAVARAGVARIATVVVLTVPGAVAAEEAWDQQRAAAAAAELVKAVDGLRDALRDASTQTAGVGSASVYRVRDRLRLLESESRHLAKQLEEGRGRDETLPVFERIDELRRSAVGDANRMFLTEPVLQKVEAARPPLQKLAGYYGVTLDRTLETR